MPIYVRAGAIVPVDPVRQYTCRAGHRSRRRCASTAARSGEFTLYDDDGISQEYLAGRGSWIRFRWDDAARQITIEPASPAGALNAAQRRVFRLVVAAGGASRAVTYEGRRIAVAMTAPRKPAVPPASARVEQTKPGTRPPLPILASFEGLGASFTGPQGTAVLRSPSDNSLAVGPDQIVQTVNSRLAVFTKKGERFDGDWEAAVRTGAEQHSLRRLRRRVRSAQQRGRGRALRPARETLARGDADLHPYPPG